VQRSAATLGFALSAGVALTALVLAIIAAAAGTFATVASIWQANLIRKQLTADEKVRRASFYKEITAMFCEFDLIMFRNPEMRPYFTANKSVPSGVDGQRVMALAEYIVDLAEGCIAAETALPELTGDWDDAFNQYYLASPALRQFWKERGHLYPDLVRTVLLGPSRRPKSIAVGSQLFPSRAATRD
jgi:hypothetical protein